MISNYLIHVLILLGIYTILTLSLNLAVGFTGLLNLGHIAFFGIGAYTSALLSLNGIPLWLSVLAGCIASAIFGLILSIPTAKLKGDYLALATLGFTFIAGAVAKNWIGLTRGALGLPGLPKLAATNTEYLSLTWLMAAIVFTVILLITKTQIGRILQAVRDDELAAKTLGRNTFAYKLFAMAVSAFFAGLAGALFAHYITFIDPSIFIIGETILVLSMLIIGGLASLPGSVAGAVLIFLLWEPLRFIALPPGLLGPLREIIYSILLVLILVYKPKGLFGKVDLQ